MTVGAENESEVSGREPIGDKMGWTIAINDVKKSCPTLQADSPRNLKSHYFLRSSSLFSGGGSSSPSN